VARIWNEQLLDAIRKDRPKPPVHARNLYHVSVAMWDAWAAYDPVAQGVISTEKAPLQAPVGLIMPDPLLVESSGLSGGFKSLMAEDDLAGYDEQKKKKKGGDDEYGDDEDGDDEDGDGGGDDDEDGDGTACGNDDDEDAEPVAEKNYDAAVEAARAETISFAAYRVLHSRFPGTGFVDDGSGTLNPCQPGAAASLAAFDAQMDALGYDRTFTSTVGDSPAALGNRIAQAVIDLGFTDGANQDVDCCYPDDTNYFPFNLALPLMLPGTEVYDPNHWQPLAFDLLVLQNGIILGAATQAFVGVGWADVKPWALTPGDLGTPNPTDCVPNPSFQGPPYLDPGCPPQLGGVGDAIVKDAMAELLRYTSEVDPNDGVLVDYSLSTHGNNSLGADDGTGYPINPATCQPYPPNVMKRADAQRVIAEFWADGPKSETPPGHWNTLLNYVGDHPQLGPKRIGGVGPVVNALEWDVKGYLALNGAVHDAAIGAWGAKHFYDSSRPITLIRHMAQLGQSSDPSGPSYHPDGLLLEPDVVEVITAESVQPGGKFETLKGFCAGGGPATNVGKPCDQLDADHDDSQCPNDGPFDGYCQSTVGMLACRMWNGTPANPATDLGGVNWRRCIDWSTYQAKTFVTPPFPGYTSGHSTFSRSAAEVLTALTDSEYYPGGMGTFEALQNTFLTFEEGPTETVQLQWARYYDSADEAAISRRFGSIHPYYDDYPARVMGSAIGKKAWARALESYDPGLPGPGGGGADAPETAKQSGEYSQVVAQDEGASSGQTTAEPVQAAPRPAPRKVKPAAVRPTAREAASRRGR